MLCIKKFLNPWDPGHPAYKFGWPADDRALLGHSPGFHLQFPSGFPGTCLCSQVCVLRGLESKSKQKENNDNNQANLVKKKKKKKKKGKAFCLVSGMPMKISAVKELINTNEIPGDIFTHGNNMLSSHVKRSPLLWLHNKLCLWQQKNIVIVKWFGISLLIINRTLHDRLEIQKFVFSCWSINSQREFCISTWPCNILYIGSPLFLFFFFIYFAATLLRRWRPIWLDLLF